MIGSKHNWGAFVDVVGSTFLGICSSASGGAKAGLEAVVTHAVLEQYLFVFEDTQQAAQCLYSLSTSLC